MVLLVAFVSACCSCVVDETSRRGVCVCGCLMDMMKWLWLWLGHAKMKKDKSCCCWEPLRSGVRRCWYIRPQTHKHDHRSIHTYKGQSSINPWPQPAICSGASRDWKSRKPPAVLQSSRPSWKRPIQSTCRIVPRGRREAILSYQWEVIRSLLVLRSAVALGRT